MNTSRECKKLIEQGASWHPLYGNRLSNHLPMALIALDRLGADASRLAAFRNRYVSRLQHASRRAPASGFDPLQALGQSDRFADYEHYFAAELAQRDKGAVLKQWLPLLMPGVAASAFHALIRLAYAIDAEAETEYPIALAYWAAEFQSLGPLGALTGETLEQVARRLAPIGSSHKFAPGIIVDRMNEIASLDAFANAASQPRELTLQEVRAFCIDAYLRTGDFTVLHAVTSTHAFRILLPYQQDPTQALRWHWQAILGSYLSTGLLLDAAHARSVISDWPACRTRAAAANDDHQIKMTYTCWREFQEYEDERYLQAASVVNFG